jgi:hypothetical protein
VLSFDTVPICEELLSKSLQAIFIDKLEAIVPSLDERRVRDYLLKLEDIWSPLGPQADGNLQATNPPFRTDERSIDAWEKR